MPAFCRSPLGVAGWWSLFLMITYRARSVISRPSLLSASLQVNLSLLWSERGGQGSGGKGSIALGFQTKNAGPKHARSLSECTCEVLYVMDVYYGYLAGGALVLSLALETGSAPPQGRGLVSIPHRLASRCATEAADSHKIQGDEEGLPQYPAVHHYL